MAEVASAFVSVMPSAKGFGSKLDSEIGGDIDSSGKRAGSKFGTALKVGALAVLGGATIAAKFLGDSIEEAREAQKVGALTASTIKATGSAAGVTAKQVGDLAEAISLKTGIDDETIQSGQNMLLTFKNIRNEVGKGNDIFDQSTETLVDLSAAMGTEPKQAAIQLGKALNDPIKGVSALSRVGVTFTEGQKKVIESLVESGETAEAQKVILKELNSEFGGAAEAQATASDKMSVAWGNLKESVGTAILPAVDALLPKLTTAITNVTDTIKNGKWAEAWAKAKGATTVGLKAVEAGVRKFARERLIPAIQSGLTNARAAWAKKWSNFWKDPEKAYDRTLHRTEFFGDDLTGKTTRIARDSAFAFIKGFNKLPQATARTGVRTAQSWRQSLSKMPSLSAHISADVVAALLGGLSKAPSRARNIAMDVSLNIINGFRSAISGAGAIGTAIVMGLIGGIQDAASQVAATAARVVLDAIQAAKNAAHIKSPSRKMHEVGQQMVEGLALGIEGGRGRANSAMDRLSAGLAVRGTGALAVAGAGVGGRGAAVVNIYDVDGVLMGTMDGRIEAHNDLRAQTARAM